MTAHTITDPTIRAYIECALWSSTDDDGNPLDDWATIDDLAPDAVAEMAADVTDFLASLERAGISRTAWTDEQLGHDFWLTRNRHGAGFWDRGQGQQGDRLTEAAHPYGEQTLYIGDDGRIYVA